MDISFKIFWTSIAMIFVFNWLIKMSEPVHIAFTRPWWTPLAVLGYLFSWAVAIVSFVLGLWL